MKTLVVNLFGGPGIGKSTNAARLYSLLKEEGYNAELAREWVKTWAYENRMPKYQEQIYVFGKQFKMESDLYGKVDVIISDSPLLLIGYYSNLYEPQMPIVPMINYVMAREDVEYMNLFLIRENPYIPIGRFENEEQAISRDGGIKEFLQKHDIGFVECLENEIYLYVQNYLRSLEIKPFKA